MSQLVPIVSIPDPSQFQDWRHWALAIMRFSQLESLAMRTMFQGRVGFGDGTDVDNISGCWLKDQVTNATPDTETSYTHNLGVVPVGILVVKQDKAGVIYAGSTAWTTTAIALKCSVASTTFTAFLLAPPMEIM